MANNVITYYNHNYRKSAASYISWMNEYDDYTLHYTYFWRANFQNDYIIGRYYDAGIIGYYYITGCYTELFSQSYFPGVILVSFTEDTENTQTLQKEKKKKSIMLNTVKMA